MENKECAKAFLKYAFTGDGSVGFYIGKARYGFRFDRSVRIACEHPSLRKEYYLLLKNLGFRPCMHKDCVSLRGIANLEKFENEIGFVEIVKISGNGLWSGFTKSNLLRFCIKSFSYRPSLLGNSKREIHENLVKIFRTLEFG